MLWTVLTVTNQDGDVVYTTSVDGTGQDETHLLYRMAYRAGYQRPEHTYYFTTEWR